MADAHVEKLSRRRAFKRMNEKRIIGGFQDAGARSVLDVGCGVGNTVVRLIECGFDAYGLTINPAEIDASAVPERLMLADIQQPLKHPAAPFDAAISGDCLEHLENVLAGLRQINAALKPGGQFVCYIPPVRWTECDYHTIVCTPRQMAWLLNLTGFRLHGREGRFRGKGVSYYAVKESAGQLEPGKME